MANKKNKIPGTPEGLPAVETAISEGINVNVTLLFSVQAYIDTAWAYIQGLEKRAAAGEDISNISSVASFFLSRIDASLQTSVFAGTIFALVMGYLIRFLAISYSSIENGQKRIARSIDEVSSSLGVVGFKQLYRVHLPLIKKSCLAGFVLTFIDICKEMPLTLMTRPYGWDTLAIKIFEFTSEGEWERASPPALAIVMLGLVPLLFMRESKAKV